MPEETRYERTLRKQREAAAEEARLAEITAAISKRKPCSWCGRGWSAHNADDFINNATARLLDGCYHKMCASFKAEERERAVMQRAFTWAGYADFTLKPIANTHEGIGPYLGLQPHFRVATKYGDVLVGQAGWFTYVIDWSGTGIELPHLFEKNVDVNWYGPQLVYVPPHEFDVRCALKIICDALEQ